jgi:Na+/proline symporter
MNMVKNPEGYGIGFPWHYIYGSIILFFVVLLIIKLIKRNKNREQ